MLWWVVHQQMNVVVCLGVQANLGEDDVKLKDAMSTGRRSLDNRMDHE